MAFNEMYQQERMRIWSNTYVQTMVVGNVSAGTAAKDADQAVIDFDSRFGPMADRQADAESQGRYFSTH